jgi:thiamine-phosphate pyrophosphorylase
VQGLYAIVDTGVCRRARVEPAALADAVLAARPGALQLRAKDDGARATLELLRALVPRCRAAGVPLFANDRPDLAVLAGCDGVHLGQSDLTPGDAREFAVRAGRPDLRIGASTHDGDELGAALEAPVDVIAVGPVFGTATKANPEPTVGLAAALALAERARAARGDRVRVAIGGIDESNVGGLRGAFDAFAVIGALVPGGLEGDAALAAAAARAVALGRAFEAAAPTARRS